PRLEAVVHPLVRKEQERFLERCRKSGARIAVLDIPLLFETGRDCDVDKVVVVSAPGDIQRARALARRGMTEERFEALLARQVPDAEKRARADFVVDSSRGIEDALRQVRAIVAELAPDSDP
ncbi:MAG: dephospho-CoA kinase, partial [Hyphomicrobiales bacterium]